MESLGPKLRQARLRCGLTLEQVSAETRIPVRILHAIEDDDTEQIGSRFFYGSFARQFAHYLGLAQDEVNAAINFATAELPAPLVPGESGTPMPPGLAPLRPRRTKKMRWMLSVGSFAAMLSLCSGLYSVWQSSRDGVPRSVLHVFEGSTVKRTPGTESAVQRNRDSEPKHDSVRPAPVPTGTGLRLEVSALEKSWLSVSADGRQVYSGILQTSETKELEGQQTARVRTGNAGGIQVVFNGKPIGPLGPKGQVRTAVFTRDRYTIVDPASGTFALSQILFSRP